RVSRLGLSTEGIRFVAVDLTVDDVAARLAGARLRHDAPSLLLVEGLVSYLDDDVLGATLAGLRGVVHVTSRLAASVGLEREDRTVEGDARAAAFEAAVAAL